MNGHGEGNCYCFRNPANEPETECERAENNSKFSYVLLNHTYSEKSITVLVQGKRFLQTRMLFCEKIHFKKRSYMESREKRKILHKNLRKGNSIGQFLHNNCLLKGTALHSS